MKNEIPFSSYQRWIVALLAFTQFTVILDFMVMSPLGDMLMKSMNIRPDQFGLVVSAYAFSAGISGLLTAGIADRFDRKKLLLFFYSGFILGTLACGFSHTYVQLVIARIVTGIFGGVIGAISLAITADLFVIAQRGRAMGLMQMGFGASQVLGIPIGLYLANAWGWEAPFFLIVGVSVLVMGLIAVKMQPVTEHLGLQRDKSAFSHLWHTVAKRHYRIGFTATALLSIGGFMMMPFGSAFAVNNLHITPEQLPLLFMVSGLSSLFIMPAIGKLSDRMDKFKLFVMATILLLVVVIIYTRLSVTPLSIVMVFNVLMMLGIMSRMIPATALITGVPDLQDRGAFMSVNSSLQQIAGGFAAAIGGMIVVQKDKTAPLEHYDTVGWIVVAVSMVAIWMLFRVSQMVKAKAAAAAPVAPVVVAQVVEG